MHLKVISGLFTPPTSLKSKKTPRKLMQNLSPLDHRYRNVVKPIMEIFSERNYYKSLFDFEISYLKFFSEKIEKCHCHKAIESSCHFDDDVLSHILEEEKSTKHDIVAVVNVIRQQLISHGHVEIADFVHFGLTSQDVVSVVQNKLIQESLDIISDTIIDFLPTIYALLEKSEGVWCLSRTHGQPATPHELSSDFSRWMRDLRAICDTISVSNEEKMVKMGGSVGNFYSLKKIYPEVDIENEVLRFLEDTYDFCLSTNTTQTDKWVHFTSLCSLLLPRISTLISDCQEVWHLSSIGYLKLKVDPAYCGSSAMPHKINPIKFENAEGCLQRCEKDLEFFIEKLSKSRLHRDLSDSVVMRMVPETLGYLLLALNSLRDGFSQVDIDKCAIKEDLEENYQVFSEVVQLYLRSKAGLGKFKSQYHNQDFYEKVKSVFRVPKMTRKEFILALDSLNVNFSDVEHLLPYKREY